MNVPVASVISRGSSPQMKIFMMKHIQMESNRNQNFIQHHLKRSVVLRTQPASSLKTGSRWVHVELRGRI